MKKNIFDWRKKELSIVKSFSVGEGDMFYIKHGSSNFTIIDCYLTEDKKASVPVTWVNELLEVFVTVTL